MGPHREGGFTISLVVTIAALTVAIVVASFYFAVGTASTRILLAVGLLGILALDVGVRWSSSSPWIAERRRRWRDAIAEQGILEHEELVDQLVILRQDGRVLFSNGSQQPYSFWSLAELLKNKASGKRAIGSSDVPETHKVIALIDGWERSRSLFDASWDEAERLLDGEARARSSAFLAALRIVKAETRHSFDLFNDVVRRLREQPPVFSFTTDELDQWRDLQRATDKFASGLEDFVANVGRKIGGEEAWTVQRIRDV